ncbi:hypothetical protein BGZ63DRAFT_495245 [Mariannaea sp. PMI_226]|nr:hypothetical protein BGZ63DRAFT_495245 [Mariannaea sp. PMI_226]
MNSDNKTTSRFPQKAVQILQGWLLSNAHYPYPNDEDREKLAQQTGLSKAQISMWMANSRRRLKSQTSRSCSPIPHGDTGSLDIYGQEMPNMREMKPMERWEHSPPEHEPVPINVIERAISASNLIANIQDPSSSHQHIDDWSARSVGRSSSVGSIGTSQSSNGSSGSAFSHKSRASQGSFGSFGSGRKRGRHRRRRAVQKTVPLSDKRPVVYKFQCTFCIETFKTKYDWRRHEKSLHLSLEQWVCSPNGTTQLCAETGCLACVYCGLKEPPPDHADQHNYTYCASKPKSERTFYRKDNIQQHLRLVHDVKFQSWSMAKWKMTTPEIRSRCGICGLLLKTWDDRADHIAGHFNSGKSMADWAGDWGLEAEVLRNVENAIPPYLIHFERNSPNPYRACNEITSYGELTENHEPYGNPDFAPYHLSPGLMDSNTALHVDIHNKPSTLDDRIQLTNFSEMAVLDSYTQSQTYLVNDGTGNLWNQDVSNSQSNPEILLAMNSGFSSKEVAQHLPLQTDHSSANGFSDEMIDLDPLLPMHWSLTGDYIFGGTTSTTDSPQPGSFLDRSTYHLPQSQPASRANVMRPSKHFLTDANCYRRLETELTRFVRSSLSPNNPRQHIPTDEELQNQARWIIYDDDDPWNQTAADNAEWLARFKRDMGLAPADEGPGLPPVVAPRPWRISEGGIGFRPPYVKPKSGKLIEFTEDVPVAVDYRTYNVSYKTANQYAQALYTGHYSPPASVFSSRELEHGLNLYIDQCMESLHFPTDDDLRAKAQEILGTSKTAADDSTLLEKFKATHVLWNSQKTDNGGLPYAEQPAHNYL